jgi:hypothetical protein
MDTQLILRSPSAFTALPNELLYILFSFLTRPDLLNLCYIRRFRNVAQDVLYQEFHADGQNVALFVRTILSDKTLASRVRRVYIKELYRYRDVQQYTGRFIAFLTRHLFYLNIPSHVKELCSKQITHRRSLATLLLSHLPKLERLDLNLVEDVFLEKIIEMGPPWILSQKQPIWTLLMLKMNLLYRHLSCGTSESLV